MRYILLITVMFMLDGCIAHPLIIGYPFPGPRKIEKKSENKIAVDLFVFNSKPATVSAYNFHSRSEEVGADNAIIGAYNREGEEIVIRAHNGIDELIQKTIASEFEYSGYNIVEKGDADIIVAGKIDSFAASYFKTEDDYLLADIQVNIKIFSFKTQKKLYENHYLAGAVLEVSDPPNDWDFAEVLENALIRLVKKINSDKALFFAMQSYKMFDL